jgi:flavin reductase (DIM6/NTAB) family NADH-FMN oxidoreductase RutF
MVVSQEPPVIAIALTAASSFQELAVVDGIIGVSLLDSGHQFPAERFAGRAPLPDSKFTGVAHHMMGGVPVLDDAPGWCVGRVQQRDDVGDHVLILIDVVDGGLGPDTDDPLLSYEGRYRRLEVG